MFTATASLASLCPSVSFSCILFPSMFLCFPPFSLDVSGFVILTAFLLLCQCDRRRCKAVPIGSVDETVYSVLAGRVRVQAETKTVSFACVCVLVKSVYLSAFVCVRETECLYKSQGKELTKQHSPVTSHSTWVLGASVCVAGLDNDCRYFGCVLFFFFFWPALCEFKLGCLCYQKWEMSKWAGLPCVQGSLQSVSGWCWVDLASVQ